MMSPQDPLSPPAPNTRPACRVTLLACLKPGGMTGVPVVWICLRRPQQWGVFSRPYTHVLLVGLDTAVASLGDARCHGAAHPELNPEGKEPCSHTPDPLPCLHEPGRQHPEGSVCGGLVDPQQKQRREIEPPENVLKISRLC